MSESLFGTDGVRGIPGREPLTPGTIRRIAYHGASALLESRGVRVNGASPRIALGRDTRASGPSIARDLARGFSAAGVETLDLGVIPTPGVSYLVPCVGAFAGVVVSASHNPAEYNGIKFFDAAGFKMSPEAEAAGRKGGPRDAGPSRSARSPHAATRP